MALPLYDELVAKVDPTRKDYDWKRLCSAINKLSEEHQDEHVEIIYALILHHDHVERGRRTAASVIPFQGKTFDSGRNVDQGGRGVMYVASHLPIALQQILATYIESIMEV